MELIHFAKNDRRKNNLHRGCYSFFFKNIVFVMKNGKYRETRKAFL